MDLAACRQDLLDRGHVPDDALALMLYGSRARGEASTESDTDVLVLVTDRPGSSVAGSLSVVRYMPLQISEMVAARSLFAWHLRTEGIYLEDEARALEQLLAAHPGPDPVQSLARVKELTSVLDISQEQFQGAPGITRVAKYLLRTTVYARAIDVGHHSFAIDGASAAVDPSGAVGRLLRRSNETPQTTWAEFIQVRDALRSLVGVLLPNEFGSLEALVVRASLTQPSLSALGLHALTSPTAELAYAASGMPVL